MPSSLSLRRMLLPALLAAVLAAVLAAPTVQAQQAAGEQVLRSWSDDVKLDDGSLATWTFVITYDADRGEYVRTVTDENGTVRERVASPWSMASPNEDEIERARALILADAELRRLYEAAHAPTITGGFELVREEGHPCSAGSRCVQFELYEAGTQEQARRLRYVVVNLQDGSIVSRNFDPGTQGNLTRFNRNHR